MSTNFEDLIMRDSRANQPAAGIPGRLYYVTDEGILERDNGAGWESVAEGGTSILLDDLIDVNVPAPSDGQVLTWDDYDSEWVAEDVPALADHDHSGDAGDGGKLDWDNIWSDAVHSHASNAEGGTLDWDSVWADAVHAHSSDAEGGTFDAANLTSGGSGDGQVLMSDGGGGAAWEDIPGGVANLDDLDDVNAPAPNDGQVLTYDDYTGEWIAEDPQSGASALDELTDVNAPAPNDGDVLTYDDYTGEWVAEAPTGGPGGGGMQEIIFHPYNNEPPSANYATLDNRNYHPCLDFDASTDESAIFTGVLPTTYGGGGLTVYLWISDTNDTNSAHASYWDVSFECMNDLDLDADSFAAVQSTHVHPNGTSGKLVMATIPFTDGAQMDSIAAGDPFRIKVTRDADNGSDDWANDAELYAVNIKETS